MFFWLPPFILDSLKLGWNVGPRGYVQTRGGDAATTMLFIANTLQVQLQECINAEFIFKTWMDVRLSGITADGLVSSFIIFPPFLYSFKTEIHLLFLYKKKFCSVF